MSLKDLLTIASPCPASWDEMEGDDKSRYCSLCSLSVHNLAVMSETEVTELLADSAATGNRLCGKLYLRGDGMVQAADCPRGLARIRESSRALYKRVAAGVALFFGLSCVNAARGDDVRHMVMGKVRAVMPWELPVQTEKEKTLQDKLSKMAAAGETSKQEFFDSLYQLALARKTDIEKAKEQPAKLDATNKALSCLFYLQGRLNNDPVAAKLNADLLKKTEALIDQLRKPAP